MGLRQKIARWKASRAEAEQKKLRRLALESVRYVLSPQLSQRASNLRQIQLIFEKLDVAYPETAWLILGLESEDELRSSPRLPSDPSVELGLAVANGLRKQGSQAMDALSNQLTHIEKDADDYRAMLWAGEVLKAIEALRPEGEAQELEKVTEPGVKTGRANARRL